MRSPHQLPPAFRQGDAGSRAQGSRDELEARPLMSFPQGLQLACRDRGHQRCGGNSARGHSAGPSGERTSQHLGDLPLHGAATCACCLDLLHPLLTPEQLGVVAFTHGRTVSEEFQKAGSRGHRTHPSLLLACCVEECGRRHPGGCKGSWIVKITENEISLELNKVRESMASSRNVKC